MKTTLDELWFFALFPPPELARRAAQLAQRPEREAKAHVTLLVPRHPVDVAALMRAGDGVRCAPFDVRLDRIETGFGDAQARILAPDADSAAALHRLHDRLRARADAEGAQPQREDFKPHLTLSRNAQLAPTEFIESLYWRAERFRLMRSLRRESRYVIEAEWALRD